MKTYRSKFAFSEEQSAQNALLEMEKQNYQIMCMR